jgi:hypothetical protein
MPLAAEQPVHSVSLPRALPFQLLPQALQEPQASVAQPQALEAPQEQPPDASAPPLPPHPLRPCPPWPLLLPRLPHPLLLADVCALSPQRLREWNSSASSFP